MNLVLYSVRLILFSSPSAINTLPSAFLFLLIASLSSHPCIYYCCLHGRLYPPICTCTRQFYLSPLFLTGTQIIQRRSNVSTALLEQSVTILEPLHTRVFPVINNRVTLYKPARQYTILN